MGNFFEDIGKTFGDFGQGFASWSGWDDAGDWFSGKYYKTLVCLRLKNGKKCLFYRNSMFLVIEKR